MRELQICHLYPDVLNLYGDRGNVLCLRRRLEWRNIGCTVTELPIGKAGEERPSLTEYDLFFIGGGQDFEQSLLLDDLKSGKGHNINAAVADGKVFLCVCGGYQLMGKCYVTHSGEQFDFLGAVPLVTVGAEERMIGNFVFETAFGRVVGFENHSGRTKLADGVEPLGRVIKGFGNNGEDGTEGVRYKNVFGTYSHGPVLPKNPALADGILSAALERKYGDGSLEPLPDFSETEAHERVLSGIMG